MIVDDRATPEQRNALEAIALGKETEPGKLVWFVFSAMSTTFPPTIFNRIDLDIDILVQPDLSYAVLDLDEFAANAARYGYPEDIRKQAHRAVADLISMIETSQFPFA